MRLSQPVNDMNLPALIPTESYPYVYSSQPLSAVETRLYYLCPRSAPYHTLLGHALCARFPLSAYQHPKRGTEIIKPLFSDFFNVMKHFTEH